MSEVDPWRDRRLSAPLDRDPQLVRVGISRSCSTRPPRRSIRPAARNEHASHILEALETGRVYRGHFNVRNDGVVTNLPPDAIVESPGFVDRFGLNMVAGITLAGSLRGDLHGVDQRAAHVGSRRRFRRSRSVEARRAARSAGRRHLHARRGLADGRRDGGRQAEWLPQYAHAIDGCQRSAEPRHGEDPRMEGRGEPHGAPARADPRRTEKAAE